MEQVQSAFVPTCDEFFLAHALDDYRQLAKQAYFFAAPAGNGEAVAANPVSHATGDFARRRISYDRSQVISSKNWSGTSGRASCS